MQEIPLFPLNTVLFPGMPINLHIFEPRYKLLIEECLQNHQPFGVALIREGVEAGGPLATPYPVGCTARITQVERLDDGRMNILVIGEERFQIHALSHDKPYLMGTVETIPLGGSDSQAVQHAARRLRPWVERYLAILSRAAEQIQFDPQQLPEDPVSLAYLAAALVQIPTDQKQVLLATDSTLRFMDAIRTIYRREVALISVMVEPPSATMQGLFSAN